MLYRGSEYGSCFTGRKLRHREASHFSQGHCSLHQQCRGVGLSGGLLCDQGCGGEQREGRERQRGEGEQPQRVKPEEEGGTFRYAWVASQVKWAVAEVGERVGAVSCREPVFVLIQ